MIKKTIIMLLLLNAILFAEDINLRSVQGDYYNGKITFIISANDENTEEFPRKHNKDWIGLYKKEDSNAWGNVLTWGWAKDFGAEKDGDAILSKNINLANGEYAVRYFLNNSFTPYKSSSFVVSESEINLRAVQGDYQNGKITFIISANDENDEGFPRKHNKDWIGLYKKEDSNAWGNVLTWGWAKDFGAEKDGDAILSKNVNLANGEYEVRYFLNNSFTTYKSSSFKVAKSDINLDDIQVVYSRNHRPHIIFGLTSFENTKLQPNPKDWIGFYKKGASNAWSNVITWVWVQNIINDKVPTDENIDATYSEQTIDLQSGKYEMRYFLNNSFTTYKSSSFEVK